MQPAQLRPIQGAIGAVHRETAPSTVNGVQSQRIVSNGANMFQGPPQGVVLHPIGHVPGQQPMNRVFNGNPVQATGAPFTSNASSFKGGSSAIPSQMQQYQQVMQQQQQQQRLPQQQQVQRVMQQQSSQPLHLLQPTSGLTQAMPVAAALSTQGRLASPVRQPLTISSTAAIQSPQRNANNMTSSLRMDQTASTLSPLTPAPLATTTPSKQNQATPLPQLLQPAPLAHPQPTVAAPPPIRDRVVHFYKKYNEAKISSVDDILKAYAGHEEDLMSALVNKYGPEETWWDPQHPHHSSSLHLHQRTLSQGTAGHRSGHLHPTQPAGGQATTTTSNLSAVNQTPLTFEQRLAHLFQQYDPSRLVQIPQLLQTFRGNEETLIGSLTQRYTNGGSNAKDPVSKPLPETITPPLGDPRPTVQDPSVKSATALKHFDSRFADIAIHDSDGDSDDGTPTKIQTKAVVSKTSPELPKPSPRSKSLSPMKGTSPEQAKKSTSSSRHVSPLQPALPPLSSHLVQHRPPALEDAALASSHDVVADPSVHPTPKATPKATAVSAHQTPTQSPIAVKKAETPQAQVLPRHPDVASSARVIDTNSKITPRNDSGRLVVSSSVRVARSPPRSDEGMSQGASQLAHHSSGHHETKEFAGRTVTRNLDQSFANNNNRPNQSVDQASVSRVNSYQQGKERSVSVSTASRSPSQQDMMAPRIAEEPLSDNVGSDVPMRSRSANGLSAPPPLSLATKKSSRMQESVSQPLWVNPSAKGALSLAYERSKQEAHLSSSLNASLVDRMYPSRKASAKSSAATSPQKGPAALSRRNSDVEALNNSRRTDQAVAEVIERRTSSAAATPKRIDSDIAAPARKGSTSDLASRPADHHATIVTERRASGSTLRSHSADVLEHKLHSTVQSLAHSDRRRSSPAVTPLADSQRVQSSHIIKKDSKLASQVGNEPMPLPPSALQPKHVDPQLATSQRQEKDSRDAAAPPHRRSRSANPEDPIYREIGRQSTFSQDIDVVVVDLRTSFKPNIRNPPPPENVSGIKPLGAIKQSPHKRTVSPSRVSRSNVSLQEAHESGVEHTHDVSAHDSTPKRKIIVVEHAPKDLPFELYSSFRDAAKKPSVPMSAWARAPVKPTSLDTSPLRRKVILGNAAQNAESRTRHGHKELIRFDDQGRMIKLIPDAPADPEAVEAQKKLCHRLSLPKPIYVRKEDNV